MSLSDVVMCLLTSFTVTTSRRCEVMSLIDVQRFFFLFLLGDTMVFFQNNCLAWIYNPLLSSCTSGYLLISIFFLTHFRRHEIRVRESEELSCMMLSTGWISPD